MKKIEYRRKVYIRITQVIIGLTILFFLFSLIYTVSSGTDGTTGVRIGAICEDGWRSSSTGSGTCSWHGGVDYWLYRGGTESTYEEHQLIDDVWPINVILLVISIVLARLYYFLYGDNQFSEGRVSLKKMFKSYFMDFDTNYSNYIKFYNSDFSNHTLVSERKTDLEYLKITYCIGNSKLLEDDSKYSVNFKSDWLEGQLFNSFNYQFTLVTFLIIVFAFILYFSLLLWILIFPLGIIYSFSHGLYSKLSYKKYQKLCDRKLKLFKIK
ncbi:hypothetical protein HF295_07240 [Hujiaoplasma nucleasis]|uniref:Uncharacterized protein n=1 Tax=Hujiaoplasma nucleasis TaxID=2725268 RepID=A0A7L6N7Y7_9MOLU|nr:hypothetical protein [Hujiaoplasma nucleasis]QLY40649.1 hypothetical protein HF295_07240 [Hujiaoplasma nucleasis]